MVRQELLDAYEKLTRRENLYEKATRKGNSLIRFGFIIFVFSVIPFIPAVLRQIILELFGKDIDAILLIFGGMIFSGVLIYVGAEVNKRTPAPERLSATEENFIKAVNALTDLDTYIKEGIEFSKVEAAKKVSKIERALRDPASASRTLWKDLTKDRDEFLNLLKQSIKEKLLPAINRGEKESISQAYSTLEALAIYLLNPTPKGLEDLNKLLSVLPTYREEKVSLIPFLKRHPILRFICLESIFGLGSWVTYNVGISLLKVSVDNAFITAITLFGTLTAGYMAIIATRRR